MLPLSLSGVKFCLLRIVDLKWNAMSWNAACFLLRLPPRRVREQQSRRLVESAVCYDDDNEVLRRSGWGDGALWPWRGGRPCELTFYTTNSLLVALYVSSLPFLVHFSSLFRFLTSSFAYLLHLLTSLLSCLSFFHFSQVLRKRGEREGSGESR